MWRVVSVTLCTRSTATSTTIARKSETVHAQLTTNASWRMLPTLRGPRTSRATQRLGLLPLQRLHPPPLGPVVAVWRNVALCLAVVARLARVTTATEGLGVPRGPVKRLDDAQAARTQHMAMGRCTVVVEHAFIRTPQRAKGPQKALCLILAMAVLHPHLPHKTTKVGISRRARPRGPRGRDNDLVCVALQSVVAAQLGQVEGALAPVLVGHQGHPPVTFAGRTAAAIHNGPALPAVAAPMPVNNTRGLPKTADDQDTTPRCRQQCSCPGRSGCREWATSRSTRCWWAVT